MFQLFLLLHLHFSVFSKGVIGDNLLGGGAELHGVIHPQLQINVPLFQVNPRNCVFFDGV